MDATTPLQNTKTFHGKSCGQRLSTNTNLNRTSLLQQSNDLFLYELFSQKESPGESLLDYVARLRQYADKCDFTDWSADKMIKCIVFSSTLIRDEELRLLLLSLDMGLDEVLENVTMKEGVYATKHRLDDPPSKHTSVETYSNVQDQTFQGEQKWEEEPYFTGIKGYLHSDKNPRNNKTMTPTKHTDEKNLPETPHLVEHMLTVSHGRPSLSTTVSNMHRRSSNVVNRDERTNTGDEFIKDEIDCITNTIYDKHKEEKPYKCMNTLKSHVRTSAREKPYTCPLCCKDFSEGASLREHLMTHTDEKSAICPLCGKVCLGKYQLNSHMTTHTGENVCSKCSKYFTNSGDLQNHMRTHTSEKPYTCPVCKECFSEGASLREHLMTHTDDKTPTCPLCGQEYIERYLLNTHMKTHTGEKVYVCSKCSKEFATSGSLKRHMVIHAGEKPHQCTTCGLQFRNGGHLKRHMLTHTGEKPHQCFTCGLQFAQGYHLKRHMLTHTGEKPHTCSQCGKQFRQPEHLRTHLRTHTGEKPPKTFLCGICGQCFSEKRSLRNHNVKVHSESVE